MASSSRQFPNIFGPLGKTATCGLKFEQSTQESCTEKCMHQRIYLHTRARTYFCISTPAFQYFLQNAMASTNEVEQGAQVPNTQRYMRLRLHVCTHARTHQYTHKHTTTQVTMSQRQLPPRTSAFASTTKGICLHNKRHLPTQPKTSTHALKGICPHNQRHLPPQRKAFAPKIHALEGQRQLPPRTSAFASTTNGICHLNKAHLPTQPKTPTYPRTQRHLPPQPKAFASTTQGICLHDSRTRRHSPPQPNSHASTMPGYSVWKSSTPSKNVSRRNIVGDGQQGVLCVEVSIICSEISKRESPTGSISVNAPPIENLLV